MNVIRVPKPDAKAFQKNRRISDLLLSQIKHFQHVVHKHDIPIDAAIARDIHTEGGAARYIATVTRAIRSRVSAPSGEGTAAPIDRARLRKRTGRSPAVSPGISIAASVEEMGAQAKTPADSQSAAETNRNKARKAKKKYERRKL